VSYINNNNLLINKINMQCNLKQFYYKKSRLQQLKGFCYTIQEGTTKKASERMGLDQSTISVQIKSLEIDLGMQLFKRKGKKLIVNDKGKALYDKAIRLIQDADGIFEEFLTKVKNIKLQNINIGVHYTAISNILPNLLKLHSDKYQKTKINIYNLPKIEALKKLQNDNLDILIYPFKENEEIIPEFNFIPIFKFKLVIIANKKHKLNEIEKNTISINEIKDFKFFHISNYMVSDMYKSFINTHNNKININLDKGNWDIAKKIVKTNTCLSSVGDFFINEIDKKELIYKYCPELFSEFNYAILVKKGKYIDENLDFLINLIKNYKS